MSGAHAKLSPSGAHRWLACPGSVAMEEPIHEPHSRFAAEGSAAHFLAEQCLKADTDARAFLGKTILMTAEGGAWLDQATDAPVPHDLFFVAVEMAEPVQAYVDLVRSEPGDHYYEQRYAIGHLTGEADAHGTSDAVIINGDKLTVIDLKYGRGVKVTAEANVQLGLYALGAIHHWAFLYDFSSVELVVHQPRLDHIDRWVAPHGWLQELETHVVSVSSVIRERGDEAFLEPGEHQCRFCKAKAHCPALAKSVLGTVAGDFVDLQAPVASQLGHAKPTLAHVDTRQLGNLMAATGLIEDWCKAIRARTEAELSAGNAVPGYKLVQGRRGARRWADARAAEELMKAMRIKLDVMYEQSLISPTTAEKRHKDGGIGPRQWPKLQELITQPEGSPSVVPETDKRPPLVVTAESCGFSNATAT